MKVIGIVGLPFCGSTVFGRVLSSLRGVIYAGELHWLLDKHKEALCYRCGHICPAYGLEAEKLITSENIYDRVAEAQGGCETLVSGDKSLDHYRRYKRYENYYFLLTREPMSHIASLAQNGKSIEDAANAWNKWYLQTIPQLQNQQAPVLHIPFEEFLKSPQGCVDWLYPFTGGTIPKGEATLPSGRHNCGGSEENVKAKTLDPSRPTRRTVPPQSMAKVEALIEDAVECVNGMYFPTFKAA